VLISETAGRSFTHRLFSTIGLTHTQMLDWLTERLPGPAGVTARLMLDG
jgi:hypothetical protein